MHSTLRPYVTAGAVIAGAGLIAITPVAAPLAGITTTRDIMLTSGDDTSDTGFTIGPLSFDDPVALSNGGEPTPGYESLDPTFAVAPLLSIGSNNTLIFFLGSQQFTLEDPSGATLGTVDTHANTQDLLGIPVTQLTVFDSDPASGLTASQAAELPADGTVYSITNLGGGFANVYEADPNTAGTAASTITDTFVTPYGNINVPTSYDAIAPVNAGAPFEAVGVASGTTGVSDNAFTIGDTTFDPGSEGFSPVSLSLSAFAPLLSFDAGTLNLIGPTFPPTATQDFEVFSGGTDAGSAYASVNASDLLGIDSTQFTVQGITPAAGAIQTALTGSDLDFSGASFTADDLATALASSAHLFGGNTGFYINILDFNGDITATGVTSALSGSSIDLTGSGITAGDVATVLNGMDVSDLPADGTVYSVTDLGGGFANVYQAIPGADGAAATITDTFVTPFGDFNVPTSYDATAPLDPGAPFAALGSTLTNADLSDNAFTVGGLTYDPGTDGFTPFSQLFGIAPLLEISGANPFVGIFPDHQDGVEVYDSTGTELGTVDFGEHISNIFGIETSQLTVTSVDAASGLTAAQTADLPTDGTVYSVTNLGGGYENVYEAIPGTGGAAATITDTLVTPHGDMDLSSLFGTWDATAPLDIGDALSDVSTATSSSSFDLFDPSTWF